MYTWKDSDQGSKDYENYWNDSYNDPESNGSWQESFPDNIATRFLPRFEQYDLPNWYERFPKSNIFHKKGKTETSSQSVGEEASNISRRKVLIFAVALGATVLAIIAVIVVAVLLTKGESTSSELNFAHAQVTTRITNMNYSTDFENQTSTAFTDLERDYCTKTGNLIYAEMKSYEGCRIESVRKGSIIIVAVYIFFQQSPSAVESIVLKIFKPQTSSAVIKIFNFVVDGEFTEVQTGTVQDGSGVRIKSDPSPANRVTSSSQLQSIQTQLSQSSDDAITGHMATERPHSSSDKYTAVTVTSDTMTADAVSSTNPNEETSQSTFKSSESTAVQSTSTNIASSILLTSNEASVLTLGTSTSESSNSLSSTESLQNSGGSTPIEEAQSTDAVSSDEGSQSSSSISDMTELSSSYSFSSQETESSSSGVSSSSAQLQTSSAFHITDVVSATLSTPSSILTKTSSLNVHESTSSSASIEITTTSSLDVHKSTSSSLPTETTTSIKDVHKSTPSSLLTDTTTSSFDIHESTSSSLPKETTTSSLDDLESKSSSFSIETTTTSDLDTHESTSSSLPTETTTTNLDVHESISSSIPLEITISSSVSVDITTASSSDVLESPSGVFSSSEQLQTSSEFHTTDVHESTSSSLPPETTTAKDVHQSTSSLVSTEITTPSLASTKITTSSSVSIEATTSSSNAYESKANSISIETTNLDLYGSTNAKSSSGTSNQIITETSITSNESVESSTLTAEFTISSSTSFSTATATDTAQSSDLSTISSVTLSLSVASSTNLYPTEIVTETIADKPATSDGALEASTSELEFTQTSSTPILTTTTTDTFQSSGQSTISSITPSFTAMSSSSVVDPDPTLTMDNVVTYEGQGHLALVCKLDTNASYTSVRFYKDDVPVSGDTETINTGNEFTYTKTDPTCDDSGRYNCQVELEDRNISTTSDVEVKVYPGEPSLTVPFEIVEHRWKETALFVCKYKQGIPAADVLWTATLRDGTNVSSPGFPVTNFVEQNQTDQCALEATSQFYYAFDMTWNDSSICCNVQGKNNSSTACGKVYVVQEKLCDNKTDDKIEHPYSCRLWISCIQEIVHISSCRAGDCYDVSTDQCSPDSNRPTDAPPGPYECENRGDGTYIPRETTDDSYDNCNQYYLCSHGTPVNGSCSGAEVVVANTSTKQEPCTPDFQDSYCAQKGVLGPESPSTGSCSDKTVNDNIPREYTYPSNCAEYYICSDDGPVNQTCGAGFYVTAALEDDPGAEPCDIFDHSYCWKKINESVSCDGKNGDFTITESTYPNNCKEYYRCSHGSSNKQTCLGNTYVTAGILANPNNNVNPCDFKESSLCKLMDDLRGN